MVLAWGGVGVGSSGHRPQRQADQKLVMRLVPGDIAVIDHEDIDEVAAQGLLSKKVRAVINAAASVSGRYPNPGPLLLLEGGVCLVDQVGQAAFSAVKEGLPLKIVDGAVYQEGRKIGHGIERSIDEVKAALAAAQKILKTKSIVLSSIPSNTPTKKKVSSDAFKFPPCPSIFTTEPYSSSSGDTITERIYRLCVPTSLKMSRFSSGSTGEPTPCSSAATSLI